MRTRSSTLTSLLLLSFPLSACDCSDSGLHQLDARIAVTPSPLAFGTVIDTPMTATLLVENTGRAPLTIAGARLGADSDSRFELDVTPATLAPGEVVEWPVTFRPSTVGAATGSIEIYSNDASTPTLVVPLEALADRRTTPGASALSVCVERAEVGLSNCAAPLSLAFGATPLGESRSGAIIVKNEGDAPMQVAPSATGATSAVMIQPTPSAFELAAGAAAVFVVDFAPVSTEPVAITVTFVSDDPLGTAASVALTGQGTTAACGGIAGRICDLTGNGPAVGARVHVDANGQRHETTTDQQGDWALDCVPEGSWTFTAENGSWSTTFLADVTSGQRTTLATEQCLSPTSARVAVVWGEWDRMQDILDRMGVTYTLYMEASQLVDARAVLETYDIVFFNCGFDEWRTLRSGPLANIRAFVEQGGSIYTSDLGYDLVEVGWPAFVDFDGDDNVRDDAEWAPPYEGPADIVDSSLAAAVGGSSVYIESPGAAMTSVGAMTSTYLEGDRFDDGGRHPMMVSFRPSPQSGQVFYTDFHHGGISQIQSVFEWLIQNL